jgi:hypothetical protein
MLIILFPRQDNQQSGSLSSKITGKNGACFLSPTKLAARAELVLGVQWGVLQPCVRRLKSAAGGGRKPRHHSERHPSADPEGASARPPGYAAGDCSQSLVLFECGPTGRSLWLAPRVLAPPFLPCSSPRSRGTGGRGWDSAGHATP